MSLARLLDPIHEIKFRQDIWERNPLLVERLASNYFTDLFSLADVDRHLQVSGGFGATHVHVVMDGNKKSPASLNVPGSNHSAGGLEALYQAYREGATLIIGSLQHRVNPLREFAATITSELSAAVNINAYLTPPHASGFGLHYDTHDVFILQVAGTKRWRVLSPTLELPLASEPSIGVDNVNTALPESVLETDLQPGSTLYIPRGYWHQAETLDSTSLHLTVGLYVPGVSEVLLSAVEQAVRSIPALRASLPLGFHNRQAARVEAETLLKNAISELLSHISIEEALARAGSNLELFQTPDLDGHLLDLVTVATITTDTRLRRRPSCHPIVQDEKGQTNLYFHGKVVSMPAFARPVVEFVCETVDAFRVSDLPPAMDESSLLLLARKLCSEGLLTMAEHA